MSNRIIEKLLNGAEVEWKPLGKVCEIADNLRKPVKASLRVSGNTPYYGANNIQDYVDGYTHDGEYVLIAEDGSASLENYSIQWVRGKFWANNHVHVIRGNGDLNNRFLFHYLRQMNFIPYLSGGGRAKLTKARMIDILIPIPPPNIQQKIVKTLDKFTELEATLEATLEAELALRKKQYQYYRETLLTFPQDLDRGYNEITKALYHNTPVVFKALGEVFDISAGGDVPKNSLSQEKTEEFSIPILSNGIEENALYGWTNEAKITKPSLTISARGTIGWTSYRNMPFYPIVRLLVLTPKIDVNLKYTYYFMKMIENNYKLPESGIPQLTKPMIKDIQISLPSLEEQQKIVNILDKFDSLTNSISEGLPKEIALRRKQYEYYREQLLDFPRTGLSKE